jgi:hypothetical protein
LANYHFDKLFDVTEANDLIPRLEVLIRQLQDRVNDLRIQIAQVLEGDPQAEALQLPAVMERFPQLRAPAARLAESTQAIESLGCFLKDIDLGLVDFPSRAEDGEVVFLCWQSGESGVLAWHPVDQGFGQRIPLAGSTKQLLN